MKRFLIVSIVLLLALIISCNESDYRISEYSGPQPTEWPPFDSVSLEASYFQHAGIEHNACLDYIYNRLVADSIDPTGLNVTSIEMANYAADYLNNNSYFYSDIMQNHFGTPVTAQEIRDLLIITDSLLVNDAFLNHYSPNQQVVFNMIIDAVENNGTLQTTLDHLDIIDTYILNNLIKDEQVTMLELNSVAKNSSSYWYDAANWNKWGNHINDIRNDNGGPEYVPNGIESAVKADIFAFASAACFTPGMAVRIAYEVGIACITTFGNPVAAIAIGIARAVGKDLAMWAVGSAILSAGAY